MSEWGPGVSLCVCGGAIPFDPGWKGIDKWVPPIVVRSCGRAVRGATGTSRVPSDRRDGRDCQVGPKEQQQKGKGTEPRHSWTNGTQSVDG
eukprot:scaffold2636_cov340-Pavlova_lutheri.AAC.87